MSQNSFTFHKIGGKEERVKDNKDKPNPKGDSKKEEKVLLKNRLMESEERFEILFEHAPDAYYINDLRGYFVDGNKAAEKTIGYKKSELIGKNFLKLGILPARYVPKAVKALIKGGQSINPGMVKELIGTVQSQNGDFGILITLKNPTRGMIEEAVKKGCFDYCYQEGIVHTKIPKIQLLTVEDLFKKPLPIKLPPNVIDPYRKPDIKKEKESRQEKLKLKGL